MDHGPEGHQPHPPKIRLFVCEARRRPGTVRVDNRSWSHMGTGRVSHLLLPACLTIPQAMCTSVTGRRWPRRSVSPRPRVSYRVSWILSTRHAIFVCIQPRSLGADLGPRHQMADRWSSIIENGKFRDSAVIDVNVWMEKAALDACVLASVFDIGLTMNPSLKRIGAGGFGYEFGALDDADNPLTKSYMDLMCAHLSSRFVVQRSCYADPSALFASYMAFVNASRFFVFITSITRWFPGLLTWLYNNSTRPGIKKFRWNKDEVHSVARKLLDSKRQELEDGTPGRDIMSLLGSLSSSFCFPPRGR